MLSPCFYKIIFKNFYDIASYHANLIQNGVATCFLTVVYEHNRSKRRAMHPKTIRKNLPRA